jgi:suppressor of cytokine signaling 7
LCSGGRCLHTRIEYRNGSFSLYASDEEDAAFPSVAQLIEHTRLQSALGVFSYSVGRGGGRLPSFPVRLTNPISRFREVKSLAYLARFVIRQVVRVDRLPNLPLPSSLIQYVAEQRYI